MPRKKGVPPKRDIRKVKMGRPTLYDAKYPEMLKEHMRKGGSFPSFAGIIGTHWDALYEWANPDSSAFQSDFAEAKKAGEALLLLFDEQVGTAGVAGQLIRKSRVITRTDVNGNVTKTEQFEAANFAQSVYIFRMKNRFPDLYRDRHEVTGKDGGPITFTDWVKRVAAGGSHGDDDDDPNNESGN